MPRSSYDSGSGFRMDRSGEAYERLISRTRSELPEVAAEIEALVAEGLRIEASKLPVEERSDLNARLDPKLSRISKDDLITTPYTNDDRLRILVGALETLSRSMTSNREALEEFFRRRGLQDAVVFSGDDTTVSDSEISPTLSRETDSPRLRRAEGLLAEAARAI